MAPDIPDYPAVIVIIRSLTLAQAKSLIKDINNEAISRMTLNGNKPEIIERIIGKFQNSKETGDVVGFNRLCDLLTRYKDLPSSTQTNGSSSASGVSISKGPDPARPTHPGAYAGPSLSSVVPTAASTRISGSVANNVKVNFRPSPFWQIMNFLCAPSYVAEAPTNMDRKSAVIFVTLSAAHVELLKSAEYQVKLFCTTYEAQAASLSGRNPAPIEFPLICECSVNGTPLSVSLRGSKKKAGRVAPPNLNKDKAMVFREGRPNRIELMYGATAKRHVLIAALCQITSVDTLVANMRQKQIKSKQDVLSRMRKEAEDDDIQAGAATMSLKCPLSYMRMTTPCKSSFCAHVQCFDAFSFFSVNEQSPSWTCPVCNREIRPENLVMDGYVDDILKRVPQDEEYVLVEPDGSWQTPDGEVSSADVTAPKTLIGDAPLSNGARVSEPVGDTKPTTDPGAVPKEIVLLDTPSPTLSTAIPPIANAVEVRSPLPPQSTTKPPQAAEQAAPSRSSTASRPDQFVPNPSHLNVALARLHNGLANSGAGGRSSGTSSPKPMGDVIDLTLDSDEDEAEPSIPFRPASLTAPVTQPFFPNPRPSASFTDHRSSSLADVTKQPLFSPRTQPTSVAPAYRTSSIPATMPMPPPVDLFASSDTQISPEQATGATFDGPGPFTMLPTVVTNGRRQSTPDDDQIRRPGKRSRQGELVPSSDPRRLSCDQAQPPSALSSRSSAQRNGNSPIVSIPPSSTLPDHSSSADQLSLDKDTRIPPDSYFDDEDWWSPSA